MQWPVSAMQRRRREADSRGMRAGELSPDDIDESTISDALATAGMPDPDLLIRTGGDMRVSNFLL